MLGDDVWEYNAPQYVDFAAGEDDPDADAWFGMFKSIFVFSIHHVYSTRPVDKSRGLYIF